MNADVNTLWAECQTILKDILTPSVYKTWFMPIEPLRFEDGVLVLQVRSQFIVEYIEENYIDPLSKVIFRVFGPQTKLEYRVQIDSRSNAGVNIPSDNEGIRQKSFAPLAPASPAMVQSDFESQLNAGYTFESFVAGEPNKLARTAGVAIAKEPGRTVFNPLFIYGGSGVGKTHLANAIGNQVKMMYPDKRVLYVSANTFQLQYQDAAANGHIPDFLMFYQTIDVLIMDDIQFLAGKKGTQDTFFHVFNYLQQSHKQIILTSDRSPLEIRDVEERLLTRFKWGLSAEITRPNFQLRKEILLKKMYHDGIVMNDDIVSFVAENVRDSVRDLEGVLASLLAYSTLTDRDIDMELANQVVSRIVQVRKREISLQDIMGAVCEEMNIAESTLKQKTRQREVVLARQISMYIAKKLTDCSLTDIGRNFGGRTHATVLHALSMIDDQLKYDVALGRHIQTIENNLNR